MIFHNYVLNFQIEQHSIPGKIGKLSTLIRSKKITTDAKKLSSITRKSANFFRNREFDVIKTKVSRKPRIFQDMSLPSWQFFLMEFQNFGQDSHHPALKSKPWNSFLLIEKMKIQLINGLGWVRLGWAGLGCGIKAYCLQSGLGTAVECLLWVF